jgi:hypothetical protein
MTAGCRQVSRQCGTFRKESLRIRIFAPLLGSSAGNNEPQVRDRIDFLVTLNGD